MARAPRPPRGGRVDRQGRTSRERLKNIRGRRFRRRFGEELLGQMGFSGSDFQSGGIVKGKLGLFTGALGGKKSRAGEVGGLPALQSPIKESNKSNPTLSTIVDQLDNLIKCANKLGVISKKQEKALLESIKETRKSDTETLIETKDDATAIQGEGISPELLAPLTSAIQDLTEKLSLFGGALDEKIEEQDDGNGTFMSRFMDELGFGDIYDENRRRRLTREERFNSPENQRRQRIAERERRASKFDPEQLKSKTGKPLYGDALEQRLKKLESIKKPSLLSRATTGIAGLIGSGLGKSPVSKVATNLASLRSSLRQIAGPLISKTLGRTALKSIPIVGIAAGAGFALNRLIQGDTVGAGLELASGLGGPLTAIPAMIAAIVRDSYASIYGVQPEQDPEAPKRIKELKTATEELVKDELGDQVEVKKPPLQSEIDRALLPETPKQKAQPKPQAKAKPQPLPAPATPPVATSKGSRGGGTATAGAAAAAAAGTSGTSSKRSAQTDTAPAPAAELKTDEKLTGAQLDQQTRSLDQTSSPSVLSLTDSSLVPKQAAAPTTRPGAVGMGDVRSPYYDPNQMGTIPDQVYY